MASGAGKTNRKVVVVGAGAVGSTFSYALAMNGLADEIVLLDKNENLAEGQALDLQHGKPYLPSITMRTGTVQDYADARVIVITAGAAQKTGETRLDLLRKNAGIVRSIMDDIDAQGATGVVVVVSNPVDVLTYVALKHSGRAPGTVIGSGTVLDSARLRYMLSSHCGVDVHNVHAYVLGEHGDSEFAAWSMTHIGGMHIDQFCPMCGGCEDWMAERDEIEQQVRDSAYHIIDYKGATSFGVGLALVRIVGAILGARNSVLTVSTLLDGSYGLSDVCLSVPCIVSQNGVARIIDKGLPDTEQRALDRSAAKLQDAWRSLEELESAAQAQ